MSGKTPKTGTVRFGWASGHPRPNTTDIDERLAEFDRWLAARDAEVLAAAGVAPQPEPARILADPNGDCSCTTHTQDAGGGYTEYLLEPEPDCPEHSNHLYDPRKGAWVLRAPKPEYEYGWELRETDSRDLFDWSDHWYATESDAREGGAIAKRQSDADSPELPPLTFTVVRRVKAGDWEPVPNQSDGTS